MVMMMMITEFMAV